MHQGTVCLADEHTIHGFEEVVAALNLLDAHSKGECTCAHLFYRSGECEYLFVVNDSYLYEFLTILRLDSVVYRLEVWVGSIYFQFLQLSAVHKGKYPDSFYLSRDR